MNERFPTTRQAPLARAPVVYTGSVPPPPPPAAERARRVWAWADLMRRVFAIDRE